MTKSRSHWQIPVFPDPNQPYVLYTDDSKHSCHGVRTLDRITKVKGKDVSFLPIIYISSTFLGSQKNRVTLTKESYAIYKSLKNLLCYLYGTKVIIKCDHAHLHNFLTAHTLNSNPSNQETDIARLSLVTFE